MSVMEIDADIPTVLAVLRENSSPELSAVFYQLEDLYERKLWYQLTLVLETDFYGSEHSRGIRLRLFQRFILNFYNKINLLKLIQFLLASLDEVETADESLSLLNDLKLKILKDSEKLEKEDKNDQYTQALVFISCEIANIKLQLSEIDDAKKLLDDCQLKIDQLNSIDNRINASYYKTLSNYQKLSSDYNSYYKTSLLYLACINNDLTILKDQKDEFIYNLSISAILGNKIYNFGEIIMHEIFNNLKIEWLKKLILSLNDGNLIEFNKILAKNEKDIKKSLNSLDLKFLNEKICIMTFIKLIFIKSSNRKILTYDEILKEITNLSTAAEIEHLCMKCLSLNLIKGYINQVNKEIEITWVQPRTMNKPQIEIIRNKLVDWNNNVSKLSDYMADNGKQVWV
ncbi:hypothetical protein PACTADRAFT_49824 [Pachysolen tannophilus NRRL Y-2460]|uniref:PCI domain-containing protein n=1 Tax=Pachysolen tannophilus NRRL Y-2460 TaxID=669874 RepID=A0A1E4TXL3_PACTA|nr:hypothetical protein PACTADRAFT_49824 [Pachysolen tannophilus NRRL Y-2460]